MTGTVSQSRAAPRSPLARSDRRESCEAWPADLAYRCLPRQSIQGKHYTLSALRPRDVEVIRTWRNAQTDVLRQASPISPEDQRSYFEDTIRPSYLEEKPDLILFSLLAETELVAYAGLTHIDWHAARAELSFLVPPQRARDPLRYAQIFSETLELIAEVAFGDLKMNRIFAETFDTRGAHIAILESMGYRQEGRMRQHVSVEGELVDSLIHAHLREDWIHER